MAVSELPRVALATWPTPVDRAERLEGALGLPPLYVKRDDLAGFGPAGNKARKLELLCGDALARGRDVLLTGGGQGSNHCLATAEAARAAGLDCVLVYAGQPPADPDAKPARAGRLGAETRFTGDPDRRAIDDALPAAAADLERDGRRPYLIPRGGASAVGAAACVAAHDELRGQLGALGVEPAAVLVATGSCGTQAGFVAGAAAAGAGWRIVGATVSRPVDECRERVRDLARGAAKVAGLGRVDLPSPEVRDARGPGFAEPSPAAGRLAEVAEEVAGLRLDPVYTAKAFATLPDLGAESGGPIVFWHTGGVEPRGGGHRGAAAEATPSEGERQP